MGLTPTIFLNQIKSGKFAKKIDWISDELFPEKAKQEKEPDELEVFREEMRLQFEKFQTEMAKFQEEIARLSSKVEKLEKEKAELASRPAEVSPQEEKPAVFKASSTFSGNAFNLQSLAKFIRNGLVGEIRSDGPKTHRSVLVNNKREYLPDLVKQIIQDHILPEFDRGTQEEKQMALQKLSSEYNPKSNWVIIRSVFCASGSIKKIRTDIYLGGFQRSNETYLKKKVFFKHRNLEIGE